MPAQHTAAHPRSCSGGCALHAQLCGTVLKVWHAAAHKKPCSTACRAWSALHNPQVHASTSQSGHLHSRSDGRPAGHETLGRAARRVRPAAAIAHVSTRQRARVQSCIWMAGSRRKDSRQHAAHGTQCESCASQSACQHKAAGLKSKLCMWWVASSRGKDSRQHTACRVSRVQGRRHASTAHSGHQRSKWAAAQPRRQQEKGH